MRRELTERRLSWLCRTRADRERVFDMEHRLKPLRAKSFGVLAVALLICGPWVGWWTLIPLAVAGIVFVLTERGLATSAHPEYRLAVAWLSLGVIAGSSVAAVLILVSSLGLDPAAVIASPQQVVFRLALLGAVALLSLALMWSDLQPRTESVIDPLTSMLNRNVLSVRVEELRVTISNTPQGGLPVTMSFGVSAGEPSCVDYENVFEAADRALHAAQAAGCNRVQIAGAAELSLELLQETQPEMSSGQSPTLAGPAMADDDRSQRRLARIGSDRS